MAEFETTGEWLADTARIIGKYDLEAIASPAEKHLKKYESTIMEATQPLYEVPASEPALLSIISLPSGPAFERIDDLQRLLFNCKYALLRTEDHPQFGVPTYSLAGLKTNPQTISKPFTINPLFNRVDISRTGLVMHMDQHIGTGANTRALTWSHGSFSAALRQARESVFVSRTQHVAIDLGPDKVVVTSMSSYGTRVYYKN